MTLEKFEEVNCLFRELKRINNSIKKLEHFMDEGCDWAELVLGSDSNPNQRKIIVGFDDVEYIVERELNILRQDQKAIELRIEAL